MLGGLLFAGRGGAATEGSVARGCLAIAAGVAAAAAAPGRVGLAVILFLGGMVIAPGLARLYAGVAAVVPEGSTTEAFAWIGVGFMAGASLGSSLGGITVDALNARATFLLAAVVPAVVGGALLARNRSPVRPADEPLPS
jgi:MFS family permease